MPDDDPRERQRWLARKGLGQRITAAAVRVWGTDLLTVRIDLDLENSSIHPSSTGRRERPAIVGSNDG
jgi:hypothetical protein